MAASLVLSWREGVSAEDGPDGSLRVEGLGSRIVLRPAEAAIASALRRLGPAGAEEDRLADAVLEEGGPGALAGWYYHLRTLARRGLVVRRVRDDGGWLATLVPLGDGSAIGAKAADDGGRKVLSRFAYLRRDGPTMVLESPRALARVVLDEPRAAGLVGVLAVPGNAEELAPRSPGLSPEAIGALLGLLDAAGMVEDEDTAGRESPSLAAWEFHDLLFHARSRKGRSDAPFGATYRMAGITEMPPAVRPSHAGEPVPLVHPDLGRLAREDPSLIEVVERRHSVRAYGARPITSIQLGELLYRVARIKEERPLEVDTPAGPLRLTIAARPYPSGGGLYELEFYVAVRACEGLDPGLYHYEGGPHRLVRLNARPADLEHLLSDAAGSAGIAPQSVQVLVVLAARFPRLAWKYASIAYALVLKHVGVVYHALYLGATAMGLAPCGLGGGDSDLFARAAGLDGYEEASVGEFLLGSRGDPGEGDSRSDLAGQREEPRKSI